MTTVTPTKPYDFENLDGVVADDFVEAILNDDGTAVRIVWRQSGGGYFYFEVPTAALSAFMPMLSKAANAAHTRDTRLTIETAEVAVAPDGTGRVLVSHIGTAGAEMTFCLALPLAHKLSAELGILLGDQAPSKRSH